MVDDALELLALVPILERAQQLGFLGREPVENHLAHARRYGIPTVAMSATAMDIGSGGGIPGLALALLYPTISWTLLDVMAKRCVFLRESVARLELQDRVVVLEGRAEELGRLPQFRFGFDVITARAFGAPAVVAECASPFLRVGGSLVVSEPPENRHRWPADGLALLGLRLVISDDPSLAILRQVEQCPEKYPRRVGLPSKRPLFL